MLRGRYRGRTGWIVGNLEDRRLRGVTKAIVNLPNAVELFAITSLTPTVQLELPLTVAQTKTPPA